MLSQFVYAEDKLLSNIEVSFKSNVDSTFDLIPIQVIINNNNSVEAWLDINDNYKIIFEKQTNTINDLATALRTMPPARALRYTCNSRSEKFCTNYKKFDFGYDFETGKLTLFYELNDNKNKFIEGEPALSLYQTLLYTESKADMNYRSGQWNGLFSSGVSSNSTVNALVSYDFDKESSFIEKLDYTYDMNEDTELSFYYNHKNSSLLSKLYANNTTGASLFIGKETDNSNVTISPIIVDIKNDGIFNVYDEYNNLVSTIYALQGINRIELPVNIQGNNIRLELVVNGEVSEKFEFPVIRKGYWGTSWRIDTGITEIDNSYKDKAKSGEAFFISASNDRSYFRTNFLAIPEAERFATTLSYIGLKNTSISMDSAFVDNIIQHDITASFSYSNSGYDFFINGSKHISQSPRETVSMGISKELWYDTRLDFFYNQSKYSYESFTSEYNRTKKTSSYKMLSSRLRTRYSSGFGSFDFSINTGTNLDSDHKIGFSINYQSKHPSSILKPSIGVQFDRDKTYSYISNEISFAENFHLTPEIRMTNSKTSQYGTTVNYSNEYISSDYSYFRNDDGFSMHVNASSFNFLSRHGIHSSNSEKNIAFLFKNQLADNYDEDEIDMVFNVNGKDNKLKNGDIVYDNSFKTDVTEIYSTSNKISLDDKYFGVKLQPDRIYHIDFKSQKFTKYITGRVLSEDNPVLNASIETESSFSKTDENGYFTIAVSANDKNILVKNGQNTCFNKEIAYFDLNNNSESEIYVGRLQCN